MDTFVYLQNDPKYLSSLNRVILTTVTVLILKQAIIWVH